jgi:EAL domain-containing protein (putative c-di-GMP-specific phosphodiesterase class I)
MSVNFSSRDFLDADLMDMVQSLLQTFDLPKESLKIEVTESVLVSSPKEVTNALNLCRDNGASVAIDDFGTGYSSLSYLQNLPADTLKIDQAFIRPMHEDERHLALVESIIHLAQRLDMVTVAEGVETEADAMSLATLNCDYLQGYYFARPMPAQDVIEWANKRWS